MMNKKKAMKQPIQCTFFWLKFSFHDCFIIFSHLSVKDTYNTVALKLHIKDAK